MTKNILTFIVFFILALLVSHTNYSPLKYILNNILDEQFSLYTIAVITLFGLLPATIFSFTKYSEVNDFFKKIFNRLNYPYIAYISITLAQLIYNKQYDDIMLSMEKFQPFQLLVLGYILQKGIYCRDKLFYWISVIFVLAFYFPMLLRIICLIAR